jgi:hypothetical protein
MVRYEIPPKDVRELFRSRHAKVKRALSVYANERFGFTEYRGIFKCEGGIVVNGREIAIMSGYVKDDWNRSGKEKPEEIAVVDAINRLVAECQTDSECLKNFEPLMSGDPLRCLIGAM